MRVGDLRVEVVCSLCSVHVAEEGPASERDAIEAGVEARATALGFRHLPEVREEGRRRHEGHLCAACLGDVERILRLDA